MVVHAGQAEGTPSERYGPIKEAHFQDFGLDTDGPGACHERFFSETSQSHHKTQKRGDINRNCIRK